MSDDTEEADIAGQAAADVLDPDYQQCEAEYRASGAAWQSEQEREAADPWWGGPEVPDNHAGESWTGEEAVTAAEAAIDALTSEDAQQSATTADDSAADTAAGM